MAKILNGGRFKIALPTGDAFLTLREPTNEELNSYQADKYDVPDKATAKDAMQHAKNVQAAFFDLLLTKVEDLEDSEGPVTLDRKDAIPQAWKSEIIFRRYDRVPVVEEKN